MKEDFRNVSRIIRNNVLDVLTCQPIESFKNLGIDETCYQKGHKNITVLTDLDSKKVIGVF